MRVGRRDVRDADMGQSYMHELNYSSAWVEVERIHTDKEVELAQRPRHPPPPRKGHNIKVY